jgi:hypothetical protein
LSTSQNWKVAKIPILNKHVRWLLHRMWIDNDVVDTYLALCGYLRPDMKFLSTHWFNKLEEWGSNASTLSVSWVSLPFHLHQI